MRTYRHHLYPRYMAKKGEIPPWGDPDSIVEVSYTQHLMFHWCNYQLWRNEEDLVAYTMMSGSKDGLSPSALGNKEFKRLLKEDPDFRKAHSAKMKQVSKLGSLAIKRKLGEDPNFREKLRKQGQRGAQRANETIKVLSESDPSYVQRRKEWSRKGSLGRIWITNGYLNKRVKPEEPIPDGWYRGRAKKKKPIDRDSSSMNLEEIRGLSSVW
jgi:hypothetical protein